MKNCLIVIALLTASAAFAADYWPTEVGATFHYVGDDEGVLDVVIQNGAESGQSVRRGDFTTSWGGGWFDMTTTTDEHGDVLLVSILRMSSGWVDPDMVYPEPSLLMIDLPLTAGTVIHQDIVIQGMGDIITVTVSGPETVSVPAGTFETMVLDINPTFSALPHETYWLHEDLGPVKRSTGGWELTSFTGVVANEDLTFGDVKTLFR